MALNRIQLTSFRNHPATRLEGTRAFNLLVGENGAGKTNVLEALSLLAPGRGLRRAALPDLAAQHGPGTFAISAVLGDGVQIGTGTLAERPSRTDLLCVAVAFAGMALFFIGKLEVQDTAGNAAAVASGVCFATFLLLLRRPGCRTETRPQAMMLGNALLAVGLLAVNIGRLSGESFTPDMRDIGGLLFLGVLQIGLAYVLFGYGIARIPALETSLIGMLEPVLNPVWVFAFLGETPGWWAVLGGGVIVAAVGARTVASERARP